MHGLSRTVQHRYRVDCLQLHTIMFTYIAIKSQSFSPKMVHAYAVAPRFFLFEPLISAPVILPPPSNAALTLPSLAAAASDAALSTADSEGERDGRRKDIDRYRRKERHERNDDG